jgi:hypothetical protein
VTRVPFLAGLVAAGIALLASSTGAPAEVVHIRPSADTYVDATTPRGAYGASRTLRLSASPVRRAYLRFDLPRTKGRLVGATLRLFVRGRRGARVAVRRVAGRAEWSEKRTTYSRAPRIEPPAVRSKRLRRPGWVKLDVRRLLARGRRADLAVSGSPAALLGSRESSHPPRLVVKEMGWWPLGPPLFAPSPPPARPAAPKPSLPPVVIGGVYPESNSFIGPFRDGNGSLYTVTELSAADPRPCIRKSTDGGRTWTEVDPANRPSHDDLESLWLVQEGTRIHVLHQRSGTSSPMRVSYHSFNTSDAPSNPDSWQTKDEVVALPGPDNQAVSLVQRSNGDLLAFYRTTPSGADQRIAWRKKQTGGSWGPETLVDSAPGKSFTQVGAVRGANDRIHIFYKNDTDSAIWHRSLDSGDTLSPAETVNDTATSTDDETMINPVYLDAAGTERVMAAWKRSSDGLLVGAVIENDGAPQAEEPISDVPVYEDPVRVTSLQAVASLAADDAANEIHAVYSDDARHGLWRDVRGDRMWGRDIQVVDGAEAEIISANVFTQSPGNGGHKVVGIVFDANTGLADNEVFYTDFGLP